MNKKVKKTFWIIIIIIFSIIVLSFKVIKYEVNGLTYYTENDFCNKLFEKEYEKKSILLFVKEIFKIRKKIMFIKDYDIEFVTPFYIRVYVTENEPVGYVKQEMKNLYFDYEGYINQTRGDRLSNVTEVIGMPYNGSKKGEKIDFLDKSYNNLIIETINTLRRNEVIPILIEFDNNKEITIYIKKIKVLMGTVDSFKYKIGRLLAIYNEISDLSGTLSLENAKEDDPDEKYIFKKNAGF